MQNATAPSPAPSMVTGPAGGVASSELLQNYRPLPGLHDEMMMPSGELRPPWRVFGDLLAQCSPSDIQSRHKTAQQLLHDHGVTYNIFDDAVGTSRPWALDLIPHIVASSEAEQVAQGIDQRSRLLDTILRDLYGPQRIIKEGWLPSALLHANPGFLRPLAGLVPPGGRFLHVAGCDLVRTEDGAWRVLADRTQVPGGQGYALENRIILSNVFPEEFNASRVQRLAAYFDVERETFRSLAPGRRAAPTILMLTPGPRDETYFEHAFKARYLGFPLVMSADLTVRDRRVHLKTLEGLRRVDVVLRSLDDLQCDPLEMHADASQGIPGMIEAWRSGGVALCNGLGTG
ncbi:MAG: circularly permuted type 2 ATP-grasp protein, partial [Verrucomicrobiales bacterium]|nr:circularly permuted type 2 ATP-grasp protein [Verrucomicrobiales bacterium]